MFGAYAAAAVILAASVVIGLALWRLAGWERASFCAPAAGYALLLIVCDVAAKLPGRTVTAAVVLAVLVALSVLVLLAAPYPPAAVATDGLALSVLSLLLVGLPFGVSGHFGVLGVGDNNDMSVHMGAAYWLQTHALQQDVMLVKPGYPLGPHAIAGAVGTGLGISVEQAFMGVMMVVPALTGLAAYAGLERLSRGPRFIAALLVGFAYMAASYYAQAAFKETILGMLLLAFVLGLREFAGELHWPQARQAVPLGVIAAGAVYTYSYPGIYWVLAALGLIWVAMALRGGAGFVARGVYLVRDSVWPLAAGALAFLVAIAPELPRVVHFATSHYANEPPAGLGNLEHAITPAQTLGVWLTPDFRFDPDPRWLTVIGLVLAAGALVWALMSWWREEDVTVPAAFVAAVVVWLVASKTKNPYNAAKGLAIMSPLVMLLIVSVLLAPRRELRFARAGPSRLRLPVAFVVVILAGISSFLALRDAPVGPQEPWAQLGTFRPQISGQRTLANFDDDFALWELRDGIVGRFRFLYTPLLVPLRTVKHWAPGQATDFDSFNSATLDDFAYVVTSRTAFASQVPPNFKLAASTPQYELWRRTGPTPPRSVLPEAGRPGARLDCANGPGRTLSRRRGAAHVIAEPVVAPPTGWSSDVRGAGDSGSQQLKLPAGTWDISLQYVSRQPVTVTSSGLRATLPGNLARMGPFYSAGRVHSDGRNAVTITASIAKLPAFGRLLGSSGHTRALDSLDNRPLGAIAATRVDVRGRDVPLGRACGRYVDWYRLGR
ncbi:MAG TPA: hypothetical protein VF032_20975 [Thermoleophilaceae bacterium]